MAAAVTPAPRWLRVAQDWPRATVSLTVDPRLDQGERRVRLRPLFPRERTVTDGMGHESLGWATRTAMHKSRRTAWSRGTK